MKPVMLPQALEFMRLADDHGIPTRLWGSMAIEYHSPSFARLGFHRTHDDIDLVAGAAQRQATLDFFGSLGFRDPLIVNDGSDGSGWLLLKNAEREQVEICFAHPLNDTLLSNPVTVPLAYMLIRSLALGPIHPQSTKAQDCITLLLDHEMRRPATNQEEFDLDIVRLLFTAYPMQVYGNLGSLLDTLESLPLSGGRGKLLHRIEVLYDNLFSITGEFMLATTARLGAELASWGWIRYDKLPLNTRTMLDLQTIMEVATEINERERRIEEWQRS
jgi:hypothetical protein